MIDEWFKHFLWFCIGVSCGVFVVLFIIALVQDGKDRWLK